MPEIADQVGAIFDAAQGAGGAEVSDTPPDPYADKQAISARIDKKLAIDKHSRAPFERSWFRNILFYVGNQYVVLDKSTGRYRNRNLPSWYPRAQTNKFAEKANDIISEIIQAKPVIRYVPATEDPADAATAEVGERVREVIYAEAEVDSKEMELAAWMVLTGNAFLVPYYDTDDKYGTRDVEGLVCTGCGKGYKASEVEATDTGATCPECSEPLVPSDDEAHGETFPIGCLNADVCSPFEIRGDHRVSRNEDWTWFVRLRRYDCTFANERWDRDEKKGNGFASDSGDNLSQYYLDSLAQISDTFSSSGGFSSGGNSSEKNPKVTAHELYELPSKEFPEGLYAVRIGHGANNVVEAKPLPTKYGAGVRKGQGFLPLVQFGFDTVPGCYWKKTRMNDLIPLQMFRNNIEANLRLSAQRMGNSMWLDPKGSGVGIISGEPGQRLQYNPVSLGGTSFAKPERIPADTSNLQPFIILINKIDDSMERVAGTFFLSGGDAPPGVQAASALAYLGERAQKSMSPLLREWAKGWMKFEEMELELAREHWDDDRLRVVAGLNKKWEVQKFGKADLQGAVNLKIDYAALAAKSNVTDRAEIAQLIQLGVLNPQDPETQQRILEKYGKTSLKGSIDLDTRQAVKEADRFLTEGAAPRFVPMVQNSVVHLMQHNDFAKTDEFDELGKEQQDIWYAHIQAHVADLVARQQAFAQLGIDPGQKPFDEAGTGEVQYALGLAGATGQPGEPPEAGALANPQSPTSQAQGKKLGKSAQEFAPIPDIAAGQPPTQAAQ